MEHTNPPHPAFTYQYSAARHKEVESIRSKYLPRKESKLDRLRKLDSRVQSAGVIPALTIGIVGFLIFGIGMCFGLDVLAGAAWLAVLLCILGAAVMLPAYPVYKRIAAKAKTRLTPEILRLSEEIMKETNISKE